MPEKIEEILTEENADKLAEEAYREDLDFTALRDRTIITVETFLRENGFQGDLKQPERDFILLVREKTQSKIPQPETPQKILPFDS